MDNYATIDDLIIYMNRPLSQDEQDLANKLLTNASSIIRVYAHDRGYNFDDMIMDFPPRADVAKDIVCGAVNRAMTRINNSNSDMSQFSQSAGGYTISGSFINPGSDLFILDNEYKRLGLTKQRIKSVAIYGND